ncbi:hypothetical protein ACLOJK_024214 [Asimina triloba]
MYICWPSEICSPSEILALVGCLCLDVMAAVAALLMNVMAAIDLLLLTFGGCCFAVDQQDAVDVVMFLQAAAMDDAHHMLWLPPFCNCPCCFGHVNVAGWMELAGHVDHKEDVEKSVMPAHGRPCFVQRDAAQMLLDHQRDFMILHVP